MEKKGQHNGLDPPPLIKQIPKLENKNDQPATLSESEKPNMNSSKYEDRNKPKKIAFPLWIYLYGATASFMSFTYGFNSAIVAAAIIFIPGLSLGEAAAIVSIMLAGALLGSLSAGTFADLLGRKPALLCNYVFVFMAALGSALVTSNWQLIVWRLIVGFGVGQASVLPALYITEICPTRIRGMQSTGNQLAGSLGMVIAYLVGATIVACSTHECWRWMFGSGSILASLGILATCFIPESPRWLLGQKNRPKALQCLQRIYGPENAELMRHEFQAMNDQIIASGKKDEKARWRDIGRRQYRKPLIISACLLPLMQAFSGNTTLVYYTALILTALGYSKGTAVLYTALTGLPQPFILFFVLFLMDRVGRKLLLLISTAGCILSSLSIGLLLFYLKNKHGQGNIMVLGAIIFFRIFYALGLGPVPQVLGPEILPFAVRAHGTAISLSVYWLTIGIISGVFPVLLHLLPPYALYWFFTVCMLFGLFLSLHYVKETRARSLEEIESMHTLPIISPDGSNRDELPKDSLASKLTPVTIIMPPPSPIITN